MIENGMPVMWDCINYYNGSFRPSAEHGMDNTTFWMHFSYLLEKAMSVYSWELAEGWSERYFLYNLYCLGYIFIVPSMKYGWIPQWGGFEGYNVQYDPYKAIVNNQFIQYEGRINIDCGLIKIRENFLPVADLVSSYAQTLAMIDADLDINLLNARVSMIFGASDKKEAETFKVLYDQIMSGNAAVFAKNAHDLQNRGLDVWARAVKDTFIGRELNEAYHNVMERFNTDFGINNANTTKRQRLNVDEVNVNNQEVQTRANMWLDTLKECCRKTNDIAGKRLLWVERREIEYGYSDDTRPSIV